MFVSRPGLHVRRIMLALAVTLALVTASEALLPGSWSAWLGSIGGSIGGLVPAVLEAGLAGLLKLATNLTSVQRLTVVGAIALVLVPATVLILRRSVAGIPQQLALVTGLWLLLVPHVVTYDVLLLVVPLGMLYTSSYRRDVVIVGTTLAFCVSVAPWLNIAQLSVFDAAINAATLGLVGATVVAASWVVRGSPVFGTAGPTS